MLFIDICGAIVMGAWVIVMLLALYKLAKLLIKL